MKNDPLGAFCNIFDLVQAIIGIENQLLVFFGVAILGFTIHSVLFQFRNPFAE